jgi:hypothetical protein
MIFIIYYIYRFLHRKLDSLIGKPLGSEPRRKNRAWGKGQSISSRGCRVVSRHLQGTRYSLAAGVRQTKGCVPTVLPAYLITPHLDFSRHPCREVPMTGHGLSSHPLHLLQSGSDPWRERSHLQGGITSGQVRSNHEAEVWLSSKLFFPIYSINKDYQFAILLVYFG